MTEPAVSEWENDIEELMEEWAASMRDAQRHVHKARNLIRGLTRAEAPKMREEFAEKLRVRLDQVERSMQHATVVQWLQEHPVHTPQVPPGIPPENRCKKCRLVKPDEAFFYDGGHGQSGYTGRCATCRRGEDPSIEEIKALQARAELLDVHVVWIGHGTFVIAHTDEERSSLASLDECELHGWLHGLEEAPRDTGAYVVVPHEPDAYSEPYGADPWDFHPLEQ